MKTLIPLTALAAMFASSSLFADTPAFSKPSGYLTTEIAGNVSNNSSGAATFVSPALIESAVFSSSASASPSGSKTISFTASLQLSLDSTYLLEITDGSNEGWWTTVVSSTNNSITVFDDFPNGLASNVAVSVRKFTTIKSWLGDNTVGLTPLVDRVSILDPVTQVTIGLSYVTTVEGAPVDGWYELSGPTLADDTIIYPGTAVKFIRFATTPLSVITTGQVKTTKTQVDVYPRDNWIDSGLAIGKTLGSLNLKGQLVENTGSNSNFDTIIKILPDQTAVPFAVLADGVAPFSIANIAESSDATNEPFDSGTGVNLRRSPNEDESVLVFPAQTIGQ